MFLTMKNLMQWRISSFDTEVVEFLIALSSSLFETFTIDEIAKFLLLHKYNYSSSYNNMKLLLKNEIKTMPGYTKPV